MDLWRRRCPQYGFLPAASKSGNNLPRWCLNSTSMMQEYSCNAAEHVLAGLQTIFLADVWANAPPPLRQSLSQIKSQVGKNDTAAQWVCSNHFRLMSPIIFPNWTVDDGIHHCWLRPLTPERHRCLPLPEIHTSKVDSGWKPKGSGKAPPSSAGCSHANS